ncbi:hypothetical protein LCGC14_1495920 [marine sediment metagenome]|uniref:Uncharacterized protein n=1 Tax=marine sediment metagenome TaxID=412755 RepID=A0A0F9M710_9ZZZZ
MQIAKWASRSGKHSVTLFKTEHGFKYSGNACGGYLEAETRLQAVKELQIKVDSGFFQPDANVLPMERLDSHLCSICRRTHGYEVVHACE